MKCKFCHKILKIQKRKFCNQSCANKYTNIHFRWKNKKHPLVKLICKNCNKILYLAYKFRKRLFCSLKCRYKFCSNNPNYTNRLTYKMSNITKNKLRLRMLGKNNISYGKIRYPKLKYSKILKHSIRSSWEFNVCKKLKENKIKYFYELFRYPLIVNKKEVTYCPDLFIQPNICVEIKGPLFDFQIEKMKRFCNNKNGTKLYMITDKSNFNKLNFANKCFDINRLDKFIQYIKK